MNYKKFIPSRKIRLFILKCLCFIPDKTMLKIQYKIKTGRKLNIRDPKRYTEKLQWYKLYYRDSLMIKCVDKYDVRKYVKDLGLGYILNDCYGIYNNIGEIDFDKLPNSFVIKDTLGGGGNSIIIVQNKNEININKINTIVKGWLNKKSHIRDGGREWPYYSGKHSRVIIEKYITADEDEGLIDYKFICFNGKVQCLYVMYDRILSSKAKLVLYDRNFNLLDVSEESELKGEGIKKPKNYDIMVAIAEQLSLAFPQVRVDLYNISGKVIFGELTFFDESGYINFIPDSFDEELGKYFILPKIKRVGK